MELSDGLREILKGHLGWGKSRLDCFVGLLLALVQQRHINLTRLSLHFVSKAEPKSRYRRLQRFFREVVFDYDKIAGLIMQLYDFQGQRYYLTLDRTNWQWGKKEPEPTGIGDCLQGSRDTGVLVGAEQTRQLQPA